MLIAILSDIHDNLPKLRAAIDHIQRVDALLCLGDLCSPFILDELPELEREVLEVMRQPLEDGRVTPPEFRHAIRTPHHRAQQPTVGRLATKSTQAIRLLTANPLHAPASASRLSPFPREHPAPNGGPR